MQIILKQEYPSGLDLRAQVRALVKSLSSTPPDEHLTINVANACLSRSAMDEFYKSFLAPSSLLSRRCTIIGEDEDYTLKLKAVKRSQNVKKHLRKFSKDQIFTVTSKEKMKEIASLFLT